MTRYRSIRPSKTKLCIHSVICKSCHKAFQFDCHKLNIQKKFAYTDGYDYDVDFYYYWAYEKCTYCGHEMEVYHECSTDRKL